MSNRIRRIAMLGVTLSPFVLLISTVNAVKGLSTAPALNMDMRDSAHEWSAYVVSQIAAGTDSASVANAIAPLTASICQAGEDEVSRGALSGSKGPGAISAAYGSVCVSLTTITGLLVDGSTTQDARREDAEALLSRLQSIPEQDNWPIFKRQNQFEATVADIQALLTAEVSENRTETVRTQLAIALNSVVTLETQGGAFGDRQAAAVAGLKAQLGEAQAV